MKIDKNDALKLLSKQKSPFLELFTHGTLSVEIYKPDKVDYQKPHARDEVYIITSGTGEFINGETKTTFKTGDFLFVPAGAAHRFVNFTDDFST